MKKFQLAAEPRTDLGKKATKALRAEGKIPAVINGGEIVNLPYEGELKAGQKLVELSKDGKKGIIVTDVIVKSEDVRKLIYSPDVYEIDMTINGESKKAVLKDLQFQPVNDSILHIDFLEVTDKKPVTMQVPVKLEGHAAGVKAGGKLSLSMKKLKVKAIYSNIPEKVVINVDDLELGKTIQVGDLHFEGLELTNAKNAVVCAVQLTRAARGAQSKAE